MEAVLKRNDNEIVETYWKTSSCRKAKARRRYAAAPSDAELEARFIDAAMPEYPQDEFTCGDIIKANSGRTIKPIEKWL